jgi:hypothetical protein
MASNPDFLKLVIKDTTLHWPRLDQPYRFNSQKRQTEACAPTAQGAAYSCAFEMTLAEGKALFAKLKEHYKGCQARNPSLPAMTQVFGMKKDEATGTVKFTAKKSAVAKSGELNKPPRVVNALLEDLADKAIWSGSAGDVRVLAFPSVDPDGNGGISLLLDVVCVREAKYGGDNLADDFGTPGNAMTEDTDFEAPKAALPVHPVQRAAPQPQAASKYADEDAEF